MSRMRRALVVAASLVAVVSLALVAATSRLSRPAFDERLEIDPLSSRTIAPLERAITLARIGSGGASRVVLVTRADAGAVSAVDLQDEFGRPLRDAVGAFAELGFDRLERAAREGATRVVPLVQLALPFDAPGPHVAAGTNFRGHADEVGHDDGPFLFPKLSAATAWNADVPARGRLDYEAELCAVTLARYTPRRPAPLGFVLCNDFTDRWKLVRDIDLDGPMGRTGFPDGKGGPGMLPIGPWLVIPRDPDTFFREPLLELYVDGRLRQRAPAGRMIWSPAEIAARALEGCDAAYARDAGPVPLTDCAGIPPRTLLLTGTPAGVMFHPLTLWSAGAYLEQGDEVITLATHLGMLRNRIR